jgi:hypothetical protein
MHHSATFTSFDLGKLLLKLFISFSNTSHDLGIHHGVARSKEGNSCAEKLGNHACTMITFGVLDVSSVGLSTCRSTARCPCHTYFQPVITVEVVVS